MTDHRETTLDPLAIDESVVVKTIEQVMLVLDPACVTQEQIVRGAFVAHLPEAHARAIGTPRSAVHLERPTPSPGYGKGGGRARYDVGFGHVERVAEIEGLLELKWASSMDGDLPAGLREDFRKLLDPDLRPAAFRISWLVAQRFTKGNAGETVRERVGGLLDKIEGESAGRLSGRTVLPVDPSSGWLAWRWASGVTLTLAWYHRSEADETRFVPLFA